MKFPFFYVVLFTNRFAHVYIIQNTCPNICPVYTAKLSLDLHLSTAISPPPQCADHSLGICGTFPLIDR
jgi:hypothetical protein